MTKNSSEIDKQALLDYLVSEASKLIDSNHGVATVSWLELVNGSTSEALAYQKSLHDFLDKQQKEYLKKHPKTEVKVYNFTAQKDKSFSRTKTYTNKDGIKMITDEIIEHDEPLELVEPVKELKEKPANPHKFGSRKWVVREAELTGSTPFGIMWRYDLD